jgi:presequence protease
LDNRDRFREMVLEAKARLEHQLVPSGHQFVDLRLRAPFSEADWTAEQMRGITSLFFLRDLAKAVDDDWQGVLVELEEMRRILVNRKALLVNLTVDEKSRPQIYSQAGEFLDLLPASPSEAVAWKTEAMTEFEGLVIPAQVNYVGKSANLYRAGYAYHGSSHVISRYLRNVWLWDKVRVQAGAYGAFCHFDRLTGIATFVSYRDPNLLKTLETYDASARFLKELQLSEDELEKNIIGMIGELDQYQLPDAKGYTSMVRYLAGETDAERQIIREEILATRLSDFRVFGEVLEPALAKGSVKVLGSDSAIQEACSGRPGWLEVTKVL